MRQKRNSDIQEEKVADGLYLFLFCGKKKIPNGLYIFQNRQGLMQKHQPFLFAQTK